MLKLYKNLFSIVSDKLSVRMGGDYKIGQDFNLLNRLNKIYEDQNTLHIIQIGAHDGVSYDNIFDINDSWSLAYAGGKTSNGLTLSGTVPFEDWLISPGASL